MQGANTINLVWAQGQKLADVLTGQGITAGQAEGESVWFWQLACSVAKVPLTEAIKERALESLRNSERCPNVFAGFPTDGGPF